MVKISDIVTITYNFDPYFHKSGIISHFCLVFEMFNTSLHERESFMCVAQATLFHPTDVTRKIWEEVRRFKK